MAFMRSLWGMFLALILQGKSRQDHPTAKRCPYLLRKQSGRDATARHQPQDSQILYGDAEFRPQQRLKRQVSLEREAYRQNHSG